MLKLDDLKTSPVIVTIYITFATLTSDNAAHEIAGNKAKGQISKWVFQENKTHHIFRKTNIS